MPPRPRKPSFAHFLALFVALASCDLPPSSPARTPGEDRNTIEAELARLPRDGGTGVALRRADLLAALGRHEEALASLEGASDRAREALEWEGLVRLAQKTGDLHIEMGRPQAALEVYGQELKSAAGLEGQIPRARALVDIGYALALMGAMTRADEAVGEAQLLAGEALTSDPRTAERMGLVKERLLEEAEASELFRKARDACARVGDIEGEARAEIYLAALTARTTGDRRALDGAEERVARALDPEPLARLRRYEAETSLRAGRYEQCEKEAAESVRIADARGLVPVGKAARVVFARCAAENGHLSQAIVRAEEAAIMAEEQRQHLTGDAARKEAGFEAFQIYRLLLALQLRLPEKERVGPVFETMERARARSHLDALLRSRAGLSSVVTDTAAVLAKNKDEAEAEVRRLTRALTESRGASNLAERHRDALWALEDIKDAIAQENPLVSRIRVPDPPTIAELRKTLITSDETLLLSYFVTEGRVVLVAADAKTDRLVELPIAPDEMSKAVRAYRRRLLLDPDAPLDEVKAAGARLFSALVGPVGAWAKAHRSLVVVPHGELASLPFEALVDEGGKFLVETHDVSYGLSATLSAELAKHPRPTEKRTGFVGMGDPVYDFTSFRAGKAEGAPEGASRALTLWIEADAAGDKTEKPAKEKPRPLLERLPGTASELRSISKLFGADQRIYLRADASEENVKRGIFEHARIAHIASHGLLEPHFQALALTLNPEAQEDGFLLHSELVDLKLNADLVVLSACQTGRTNLRSGEPVAGLALALRSAGAERVVVSLWSVDDDATSKLMVDFYKPLVKDATGYAAALSAAKRQMIDKGPAHPFYWAPFVLLGP
ncbi:CHAT domain-containing protein [Polyangium aurulentum]|uniref:CHAT domain-containing protein n=1 Tax=Polyangium aurulentum TaxID=2567896 RepID=UPI00146C97E5|nr:CHAT domain-containing tetratricopeptide repeat protein [Polyangium aurulentum]UQA54728.1 CHAT domain-containing protein [Polyangium aurulentum]